MACRAAIHSLFVVLCVLPSSTALAQPAAPSERVAATFDWQRAPGAEECIDAPVLEQGVEIRLARRVFVSAREATASRVAVRVKGRIEPRAGSGFHAVLELETLDGTSLGRRELETN